MTKKKGKTVSFDAMVKFFIQYYDLPTKADIEKLFGRIDRLEMLMQDIASGEADEGRSSGQFWKRKTVKQQPAVTAADTVYEAIKTFKTGADLSDLQVKTGFGEKKLRNIIFRLNKLDRIQRMSRGVYVAKVQERKLNEYRKR